MSFDVNAVKLASLKIQDELGRDIVVGSLWKNTPIIFVFLRHFGCIACYAHATDVWQHRDKYLKTGARIVFVGNGSPEMIQGFKQRLGVEQIEIYTDPSLESFRACGFKRGFLASVGLKSMGQAMSLKKKGFQSYPKTKADGDSWQLGGIVAIKPGGLVTYQYISTSIDDFPYDEGTEKIPWLSAS